MFKLNFQYNSPRNVLYLDTSDRPVPIYPNVFTDPRDTLKKNTIKNNKDFSIFRNPVINKPENNSEMRSPNIFTRGMIEKVSGPPNNCSSCGGAK